MPTVLTLLENLLVDSDEQLSEGDVTPLDSLTLGDDQSLSDKQKCDDYDDDEKHDISSLNE